MDEETQAPVDEAALEEPEAREEDEEHLGDAVTLGRICETRYNVST